MKRLYMIVSLLMLTVTIMAQPSWVKKATKSVFTLKTFTADGTLLGSANGFYVGKNGEAISCFAPFKGAQRAVVIDAAGKEYEVACILGANETYDVAKFRVTTGKTQALTVAQGQAPADASVWLLPYNQVKKVPQGTVRKAETFNQNYAYYTVALQMPENSVGAPLFSETGEVLGLMQQPASLKDTLNYAVSALFADSLKTTGLSINDPVLRATGIRKALPQDVGQAQLSLYIGGASLDSLAYCQLIEDFILQFPNHPDGYTYRAQQLVNGSRFADAERDMKKALKVAEKPDEVHYTYSRLMLQKLLYMPEQTYDAWSFDGSYDEAGEAYRINPLPTYRQQQAVVRYAQQRYDDAYAIYEELFTSSLRSPELFYAASVCKEQLKDSVAQLALLDSCMAQFSRPYLKETAPYLLHRAQLLMDMNRHREAVTDLNDYEALMKTQLTSNFYYMKYQAEMKGRLFQQALDDINEAIRMTPQSDLYYAEKASLQVRVGLYSEAVETAKTCIQLAPDHSDGYLFLGLSQCLQGQKTEGVKNLQKAGELGDPQAEGLIEKYSK
ncbi:serine protease [uncultured Prevotella sp.]|uniref:serine protease n=1 Tax=uncultured Prevotella sp. TaxID=159272 RepID=UPI002584EB3A|nr:serine protease [uncultured Prevotella sp.]